MSLLLNRYNKAKQEISDVVEIIKVFLKDETKPLNDRWELLCKFENDLPQNGCYEDVDLMNDEGERVEITYYDDLYTDKGCTIEFSRIVELLQEATLQDYSTLKYSKAMIDRLKEKLLLTGYGSTCNDW